MRGTERAKLARSAIILDATNVSRLRSGRRHALASFGAILLKGRGWIFGAGDLHEPLNVAMATLDVGLAPCLPLAGRDELASLHKLSTGAIAKALGVVLGAGDRIGGWRLIEAARWSSEISIGTGTSSRRVLATENSVASGKRLADSQVWSVTAGTLV